MRPLFVPLKREYFEAFRDGRKTTEFRVYGPRWNERTCVVGREVVLSLGYSNRQRIRGVITRFYTDDKITQSPDWKACYGNRPAVAACIEIRKYAEVTK